jgi:hypothetical protein
MNFWLIPRLLAEGSAYACLLTQFITAILQVIIVIRIFRFPVSYRYLVTLFTYTAGVIFFNFISLKMTLDIPGLSKSLSWLPGFTLAVLFSFLLAVALKLLSLKSLMNILRNDR